MIVSVLPHRYVIVHVYRCYVIFEGMVGYKCTNSISGYSHTRAVNQPSNDRDWTVVVFGKPVISTHGVCGSVLFMLPLNPSGY